MTTGSNRWPRAAVWAVAMALGGSAAAEAGPKRGAAAPEPAVVDVAPVASDLVALRAEGDRYIVLERGEIGSDHFYFGDAERLYRQRGTSGSAEGDKRFERRFWAPRVDHKAWVAKRDGSWSLHCGERVTPLVEVSGDARADLVSKATFHEVKWQRQAYALARDDRGRYYYVDKLRDERGGKGFRLFIGQKGRLKPTKLINIVSDSEGDIFSSRRGELRLIMDRGDRGEDARTLWIRRKRKTELVTVPLWGNVVLIYRDLGVYAGEPLGTPCDFY